MAQHDTSWCACFAEHDVGCETNAPGGEDEDEDEDADDLMGVVDFGVLERC